jgi:glucoamylase
LLLRSDGGKLGTFSAMTEQCDLPVWIERQTLTSIAAMQRAISAKGLTRERREFGQKIIPAAGSVLASPEIANWDPEPDYFFHWVRDSAIVMRTVAELMGDAASEAERLRWRGHFEAFVRFSLSLSRLDGADIIAAGDFRRATADGFKKFLRPDAELRELKGSRLLGEPRFNPDGSIDVLRWSRPQYDGPALRALACFRYLAAGGPASPELDALLRLDLDFTLRFAGEPCIGPWEEAGQVAQHYYVALAQLGALVHGRAWAGAAADEWQAAEARLRAALERHWSERHQAYLAMWPFPADEIGVGLDSAVLLAVLDADLPDEAHSVRDPRVRMTLTALEHLFAREFPINHRLPAGRAPALGRSRSDRYFGGGAWYPTTLAAAAICYRLAQYPGHDSAGLIAHGDGFMATVRAITPADGALSEQVDRMTGAQTSARHLTWSYAAFVSAARLRAEALI